MFTKILIAVLSLILGVLAIIGGATLVFIVTTIRDDREG